MILYFIFLFSYFLGGWGKLEKDKKIIGEEYLLKIWKKIKNTIIINVGIIAPIFFYVIDKYIDYKIPDNVHKELLVFCVNWVVYDFVYYFLHRLMHTKYFYALHKKSHEIKEILSFTIYYCSSIDFLILKLLPLYIGIIIFNGNIIIYVYMTVVETFYRMKRLRMDVGIFHMRNRNCNFGVDLFMDKWMNTRHSRKVE